MQHAAADVEIETEISCVKCKQAGLVTWVRNVPGGRYRMTATSPVRVTEGFYLRVVNIPSYNPQIVCGICGTVHRDRVV